MASASLDTSLPRRLERHGFAFVQDVGSRLDARATAEQLGTIRLHRDSDRDGATSITPVPDTAGPASQAFGREGLEPHTDGTAVLHPADLVVNYIEHQAQRGGHALLTDGTEILAGLPLRDAGIMAALSRGEFLFGADGFRASVLSRLRADERWTLRYRDDGELRPLTSRAAEALDVFAEVARACTWELATRSGDLYITDNRRCLHGRTAFVGSRSVVRFLVDAPDMALGAAAR